MVFGFRKVRKEEKLLGYKNPELTLGTTIPTGSLRRLIGNPKVVNQNSFNTNRLLTSQLN